jgi:hypothetical protein
MLPDGLSCSPLVADPSCDHRGDISLTEQLPPAEERRAQLTRPDEPEDRAPAHPKGVHHLGKRQ